MSKQLSWMSTKATQLYILRIERTLNFKTTKKKVQSGFRAENRRNYGQACVTGGCQQVSNQ
jgi:hypothetical protein